MLNYFTCWCASSDLHKAMTMPSFVFTAPDPAITSTVTKQVEDSHVINHTVTGCSRLDYKTHTIIITAQE